MMPERGQRQPGNREGLFAGHSPQILVDPEALWRTLLATGSDSASAIRSILEGVGKPPWQSELREKLVTTCTTALRAIVEEDSGTDSFSRVLGSMFGLDGALGRGAFMACKGLVVKGSLDFSNEPRIRAHLTALPEGFQVRGYCDLEGCQKLSSLPDGFKVGGDLYLHGTTIQALPDGLRVDGDIALEPVHGATGEAGNACLTGAPRLAEIGENVTIKGWLSLVGQPTLTRIGPGLAVESLHLIDCPNLDEIGSGLYVRDDLVVKNCPSLKGFPSGMHVENLHINGCPVLPRRIPADAEIAWLHHDQKSHLLKQNWPDGGRG